METFCIQRDGSNALYLQPVNQSLYYEKQVVYEKFHCIMLIGMSGIMYRQKEFQTIRERIDLSGNWNSSLGNCTLPGTTDENKLGDGRHPTNVTSQLTRTYPYSGIVEYEKDVEIPVQMEGKRLILFMERTKPSTLWIDGDSVGTLGHIYAPHCYSLPVASTQRPPYKDTH